MKNLETPGKTGRVGRYGVRVGHLTCISKQFTIKCPLFCGITEVAK